MKNTETLDELPYSVQAEQCLLAELIYEPLLYLQATEHLKAEDFFLASHRSIYKTILELAPVYGILTTVSVADHLASKGELESAGGLAYISECIRPMAATGFIAPYIKTIKELSLKRQLINSANLLMTSAKDGSEDLNSLIETGRASLQQIAERAKTSREVSFMDLLHERSSVEKLTSREILGLKTGYPDLDMMLAGLRPGEQTIIAARPGVGKTSLALNILEHVAESERHVLFASLEMSAESLLDRMICSRARVDFHCFRACALRQEEVRRVEKARTELERLAPYIHLFDCSGVTPFEVFLWAERLRVQEMLDLVVVDYIQIMRSNKKCGERRLEIDDISISLRNMGRDLKVPTIALSQLSRASEHRQDHRPQLSDLRESGSIEQNADNVLFLFREEMYGETGENLNLAEVIIAKQRNGPTGSVHLAFLKEFTKFESLFRGAEVGF